MTHDITGDITPYQEEWSTSKRSETGGLQYRTGRMFVLHVTNISLIPGVPYGLLSTARSVPECRVWSNP